jgi:hypothetical protein
MVHHTKTLHREADEVRPVISHRPGTSVNCELDKLQEQLSMIQTAISCLRHGHNSAGNGSGGGIKNSHNCSIQNSNNTQVTNITVNAFGQETLQHISTHFLDQCVRRRDKGLVELIGKIHYDTKHAGNNNMKITNRKDSVMMVHDGNRWRFERKESVLKQLMEKGHALMQEHFDDHEERMKNMISQTMFGVIQDWMDKMQEEDKNTIAKVIDGLYLLILNSSMQ